MFESVEFDTGQIRAHTRNVEAIKARFNAVKTASSHIAQNDAAYGLLCGWISAILEGRHKRQDELIAYVEENLSLVADGLRKTINIYEAVEADNRAAIHAVETRLD